MEGALLILILTAYFLPTLYASAKGHPSSGALFFVNLLVGWTIVGWIVCLLWAKAHASPDSRPRRS